MSDIIKSKRLEGTTLIVETEDGEESYDSKFLVAAMLIFIARGSGTIEPEESAKMIDLIEEHFQMEGAESLELLTRAMTEMIDKPELGQTLMDAVGHRQRGHRGHGAEGHRSRRQARGCGNGEVQPGRRGHWHLSRNRASSIRSLLCGDNARLLTRSARQ
jgi:hypothetical protein